MLNVKLCNHTYNIPQVDVRSEAIFHYDLEFTGCDYRILLQKAMVRLAVKKVTQ